MVAKTWYMTNSLAGTAHQEMSETDPGTEANASPQTGWVVGTGATNHASFDAQSNVASASFTATTQPDGTPTTTAGAGDCLRTTDPYTGNFASGNWTFSFCFRGVTQAGTQDGRVRFRLLRGKDPTGSDAVDISGSQQQASLVTNLLTTPTQTSSLVVNPGAFEVSNQYIFVQIAWERTGAGGMTTTDVAFRIGNASGAGTRVVSADFTPTAPRTDPPDKTGVLTQPGAHLRRFGGAAMSAALLAASGATYVTTPPPEAPEEFYVAPVTISVPLKRTLFYQARCEPVQLAPVVDSINASVSTTTGAVRTKSLFYQARIEPPVQLAVDNTGTLPTWHVQLSQAPPRPTPQAASYTPFVPQLAPPVTADEWLQPFRRQVAGPSLFIHTQPVLGYAAAPQVTPDEWLQPLSRAVPVPPVRHTQPVSGYKAEEVVAPTTTLEWLLPFNRTALPSRPVHTQPVSGYPYEAEVVVNTETIDKWQQPLSKAAPRQPVFSGLYTPFVPKEATVDNTVATGWHQPLSRAAPIQRIAQPTQPVYGYPYEGVDNTRVEWDWSVAWQGPPRYWPPRIAAQPFVPREATLENTVVTGWHQPFYKAVPPPRLNLSQPVYGFPYEGVDNTRNEWDWHVQWPGPPRRLLGLPGGQPFVAKQFVQDVHGPEKWLQAFKAPPRYWPLKVQAVPFVPREATLENTVATGWHQPLYKAVPVPKPVPTQPVFGYPYETQAIVVPYEQWWQQPLSRAAPRPAVHNKPYQPFVPREATLENTITGMAWLQRWQGPPRYTPLKVQTPPFVPKAAVEDVHGPDKWHRDLSRAAARPPVIHTQPGWSYAPVAVVTLTTTLEWQQPLSRAVAAPKAQPTQPLYVTITPAAAAEDQFYQAQVTGAARYRKALFYQSLVQPYYPYEQAVVVTPQYVQARLTVALHRMLRYSCKAEQQDQFLTICTGAAFTDNAFQNDAFQICPDEVSGDPWATQGEATEGFVTISCYAFVEDAFQNDAFQQVCGGATEETDPWATQAEAVDPWGEKQQSPSGPGCDECR